MANTERNVLLTSQAKYNIEDSNIALLGSDVIGLQVLSTLRILICNRSSKSVSENTQETKMLLGRMQERRWARRYGE